MHLARRAPQPANAVPRLSVVVPLYNVERYLAECLDSLLDQSFTDFEVVIIDDGATDGSVRIAQGYVSADSRFLLFRQANAGLGAARNTGVRAARGEFLTFLDSDDTLPPHAYAEMMGTIERTGSDMVVGTLKRRKGRDVPVQPRLVRENHRWRREGCTLVDMPLILADVFAVNKVYRRSFWDEASLAFPVDMRYEDQPTVTGAFLAAKRFDVIPETVYYWRVRDDGSSITQQRDDIHDLQDRILTKRISTEAVTGSAPDALDVWFGAILPVDMWEYFRAAPHASERYWQILRAAMAEFWSDTTMPFDRTLVPVQQRLMGWLVKADRRQDLAELLAFIDSCAQDLPVEVRGETVICLLPGVDDEAFGAPASTYALGAHELRWDARVISGDWRGTTLSLRGFALIHNVATLGRATSLRVFAVAPGGTCVDLTVRTLPNPRATKFVGRPSQNYDNCGFTVEVDVARLMTLSPPFSDEPTVWRFAMERTVDDISGQGGVTSFNPALVDSEWQPISPAVEARLVDRDGDLVLELGSRKLR